MKMDMIDSLMSHSSVVLKDIVVFGVQCQCNLLGRWKNLLQNIIWNLMQILCVVFVSLLYIWGLRAHGHGSAD